MPKYLAYLCVAYSSHHPFVYLITTGFLTCLHIIRYIKLFLSNSVLVGTLWSWREDCTPLHDRDDRVA